MSRLVSTTDRRLIRLLQQNARVSFAELSRVTGIPESTVRRRVERMQERGIIRYHRGLISILNMPALDLEVV